MENSVEPAAATAAEVNEDSVEDQVPIFCQIDNKRFNSRYYSVVSVRECQPTSSSLLAGIELQRAWKPCRRKCQISTQVRVMIQG